MKRWLHRQQEGCPEPNHANRLRICRHSLPAANLGKKPLQIVAYSRQARANVLRLLALYRWKLQSDLEPLDDVVTSQVQENGVPPGSAKLVRCLRVSLPYQSTIP
jgi:hypothetical protein